MSSPEILVSSFEKFRTTAEVQQSRLMSECEPGSEKTLSKVRELYSEFLVNGDLKDL